MVIGAVFIVAFGGSHRYSQDAVFATCDSICGLHHQGLFGTRTTHCHRPLPIVSLLTVAGTGNRCQRRVIMNLIFDQKRTPVRTIPLPVLAAKPTRTRDSTTSSRKLLGCALFHNIGYHNSMVIMVMIALEAIELALPAPDNRRWHRLAPGRNA